MPDHGLSDFFVMHVVAYFCLILINRRGGTHKQWFSYSYFHHKRTCLPHIVELIKLLNIIIYDKYKNIIKNEFM